MNPEEKSLAERALKVSQENNAILRRLQRTARMAIVWGFVKLLIVVIPLIIGYIYFSPNFGEVADNYQGIRELFNEYSSLPR